MKDLIAKLEAATEEQEKALLLAALDLAYDRCWIDRLTYHRAYDWVKQGAGLCAALTLLPAGYWWMIQKDGFAYIEKYDSDEDEGMTSGGVSTTALALCAVALKARMAE